MHTLRIITAALLVIGGLNWGLIGFFQYNLIAEVFGGSDATFTRVIYMLVGISALHQLFVYPWNRRALVIDRSDNFRKAA